VPAGLGGSTEGELLGLAAQGVLEGYVALGNEERAAVKSGQIVELEEAIFGFALRFEFATAADVRGRDATIEQRRANHQKAVTLERIFLGTHESDVIRAGQLKRVIDTGAKILGFAAFFVVYDAVDVVGARVGRASSERVAEKFVSNSSGGEAGFKWLTIELWKAKTAGAAADVAEDLHIVRNENFQELVELQARMADGKERRIRVRRWLHERSRSGPEVFCRKAAESARARCERRVAILLRRSSNPEGLSTVHANVERLA